MNQIIYKNQTTLRCGYTTGSCAAAAAQAAVILLLTGQMPNTILLPTPKGITLHLCPEYKYCDDVVAACAVRKDSGDDPDITNGIVITAQVTRQDHGFTLLAGEGIGIVTQPGLAVEVGQPAINPGPRAQIEAAVKQATEQVGYRCGIQVTISAENGRQIAKQTYNEHLGIINGISILGTSGIVEPMSEAALIDTIQLELNRVYATGSKQVLICPGNYGADFAHDVLGLDLNQAVKCSNFIGDTLDYAVWRGFSRIFLVGHAGKLIKLAAGIMNTHSSVADGRQEIFTAYAALSGAQQSTLSELMHAVTVDACLDILIQANLKETVLEQIGLAVDAHLRKRVKRKTIDIAYLMFTNRHGVLAQSPQASKFCKEF